jgi:hypothetical protein
MQVRLRAEIPAIAATGPEQMTWGCMLGSPVALIETCDIDSYDEEASFCFDECLGIVKQLPGNRMRCLLLE